MSTLGVRELRLVAVDARRLSGAGKAADAAELTAKCAALAAKVASHGSLEACLCDEAAAAIVAEIAGGAGGGGESASAASEGRSAQAEALLVLSRLSGFSQFWGRREDILSNIHLGSD